jgi:phospholipase/carboxylesterase
VIPEPLQFVHRFEPARRPNTRPLLLLHGTGGNEDDLLPIGQILSPDAALLSPRGQVLENGMPRFFRRLAEGVFDYDDVRRRAIELAQFIAAAKENYHLASPIAVGYSNGANIAAAVLLLKPEILAGAILFRAMLPLDPPPQPDLAARPVLITSGLRDPVIPAESAIRLAALLSAAGARVEHKTFPVGHELSQMDLSAAQQWLAKLSV